MPNGPSRFTQPKPILTLIFPSPPIFTLPFVPSIFLFLPPRQSITQHQQANTQSPKFEFEPSLFEPSPIAHRPSLTQCLRLRVCSSAPRLSLLLRVRASEVETRSASVFDRSRHDCYCIWVYQSPPLRVSNRRRFWSPIALLPVSGASKQPGCSELKEKSVKSWASMATQTISETAQKIVTPETLRYAAKQSERCLVVPVRLRRAIKKYLREQEEPHMKRKVLRLSQSFNTIKDVNLQMTTTTSREIVEDPFKSLEQSKRWKIKSSYGDIGLSYRDDETIAYVASRMPAVYSACYRVLKEVRRRLPGFSPAKVLDFGAGTGSAFWAMQEVWPKSLEKVNLIEPSQSMQRAGRSLIQGLKNLPLIHSYDSIQALSKGIGKSERGHDLVIASYVLGEIPSLKDRITIVRQLWDLTQDVLVLVEPGTPHGSNIIAQMRSHILWMEQRKHRKSARKKNEVCKDLMTEKAGAFVVAPCPHDGICPLVKSGKYCHFVQRLERTSSQRAYKRSKGEPLRGFEDEKFSFVAFRRGQRPREPWPLDDMEFETLKELRAKRNPEDLEIDYEDWLKMQEAVDAPREVVNPVTYDSDEVETDGSDGDDDDDNEEHEEEKEDETGSADLGGGWGRIVFMPVRRGRQVTMNVCRSTNRDASEGSYDRIVVTQSTNPTLHRQAKRSIWGDLWPF